VNEAKEQQQGVLPTYLGLVTNVISENLVKLASLNDIPTSPPSPMQKNK
jgi:hypothetical protein